MYWHVAKEIYIKDISILALNFLTNFGRSQHEDHFCEIILVQEVSSEDVSYLEIWQPLFAEKKY